MIIYFQKKIRTTYICLIFISTVNLSIAQKNIRYLTLVNDAELSIYSQNYQIAAEKYNAAFKLTSFVEAKDLHNAIVCNILVGKIKQSTKLAISLIKRGADSTYFFKNDYFKPMINHKIWFKKVIKEKYFIKEKFHGIDTILRNELMSRYKKDQDYENPKRNEYISENSVWFKDMILQNKFPSQEKIGIFITNGKIQPDLYQIMLTHYFDNLKPNKIEPLKSDSLKLSNLLFDLAKKDELNPAFFASLNIIGVSYNLMPMSKQYYIVAGDSVFIKDNKDDVLKKMNMNRSEIGLHNLDDYMKIIKFNTFDKRFMLTSGNCIGVFDAFMASSFKNPTFKNIGHKKDILNIK